MKTNKIILTFIFVLVNLLSFSQIKVLSTGNVSMGSLSSIDATLNLYGVDKSNIYSKVDHSFGWGEAIKSQVNRPDAIAFSAYYIGTRNFMVFGNGDIWSATKITFSDSTLKTNINSIESQMAKLGKLKGVTYNMKNDKFEKKKNHIGLIAQDVEKIFPDIVYTDDHGVKGIAYERNYTSFN